MLGQAGREAVARSSRPGTDDLASPVGRGGAGGRGSALRGGCRRCLAAFAGAGGTALAWEGFRLGVDRPLDLRLTDIALTDTSGHVVLALPHGAVSLSLRQ